MKKLNPKTGVTPAEASTQSISVLKMIFAILLMACVALTGKAQNDFDLLFGNSSTQEFFYTGTYFEGDLVGAGFTYSPVGPYMVRIDAYTGQIIWELRTGDSLNITSIANTSDGNMIIGGHNRDASGIWRMAIRKINGNGTPIFTKYYYGEGGNSSVQKAIQTADNGYAILGRIPHDHSHYPLISGQIQLIKTDANGDSLWSKKYSVPVGWKIAHDIIELTGGGYMMCGEMSDSASSVAGGFVMRTDVNGNELWTETFGAEMDNASDLLQIGNSVYVLNKIYTGSGQVLKFNLNGSHTLLTDLTYNVYPESLTSNSSNLYILVSDASNGTSRPKVYHINTSSGNAQLLHTFGTGFYGYDGRQLISTWQDQLTLFGMYNDPAHDAWVASLDVLGNVQQLSDNCSLDLGNDTTVCQENFIPDPQITGTGPFTYQWAPSTGLSNTTIANPVISNVYMQEYTLTVTDANNCVSTDTITVTTFSNDPDTVNLCNNGTATLYFPPANYYGNYTWTDTLGVLHHLGQGGSQITVSQPGLYSGSSFTQYCGVIINNFYVGLCEAPCINTSNNFTYLHNTHGCYNDSVLFIGTGSGSIVSWNWSAPGYGNFGNQPTVYLDMIAGFEHYPNYNTTPVTLTTIDNNGCTSVSSSYIYPVSTGVRVDVHQDTAVCTGSYTVTPSVTNGTAPYTYQWEPEAYFVNPNLLTQTFTDVYNEAFYLYVTDANGCSTSDTLYITVADTTANFDTIQTCTGQTTLSLPHPTLGSGSYLWSNGATTQSIVFNGTGNIWGRAYIGSCYPLYMYYTIVPCNTTCSVDLGPDTTVCQGSFIPDPQLTGTGPFTYYWTPPIGLSNPNIANPVIEDVYNQQYTLIVTDANNCIAVDNIIVSSYTVSSDSLFLCNDSVTLDLGPGSTYQWLNWQDTLGNFHQMNLVTQTISVTEPGTYTALEYTLDGCGVLTSQFFVGLCEAGCNDAWNTFTYAHSQLCNADNIQLAGTGSSEIVSWEWYLNQNPNPFATTQNATLYLTGSTPVYVTLHTTDQSGCLDTTTQLITPVFTTITVDLGSDTTNCNSDYTVTPQLTGGSAPFTFTWTYDNYSLIYSYWMGDPLSQTFTDIYQTPVSFTVTDANGCIGSDTVIVTAFDNLPNIDTVYLCNSTAYLRPPLGAQSYTWSTGATTPGITVNTPGTYTGYGIYPPCGTEVHTFHVLPCSSTCSNVFTYQHNPWACGDSVLFVGTAGNSVVSWTWNFGDGQTQSGTSPTVYHYYQPQSGVSYTVTLTTVDVNGCTAVSSNTILIQGGNPVNVSAGNDQVFCTAGTYNLDGLVTGGSAPYTYQWTPSTGLSSSTILDPSAIIQGPVTYTLTATDANGCSSSDAVAFDYRHPINDTLFLCGTSVTLCQDSGAQVYDWMGGELTQCITVTDTGHYWGVETFTGCGVTLPPSSCYSFDEQNLNVNQIQHAFYLYGHGTNGFLDDWRATNGTPSVHPSGNIAGVNAYEGNQYALLAVCDQSGDSEGISLEHNFQQGHSYTVSLAVRNTPMISGSTVPIDVSFVLLQNSIPFTYQFSTGCTSTPAIPGNSLTAHTMNSFDDNYWQVITFNITNLTDDYSQLWFRAKRSSGAPQLTTFFMIDSLCISEMPAPSCISFEEDTVSNSEAHNAFFYYGEGTNGFLEDWHVTNGRPAVYPNGQLTGVNAYDGNQYAYLRVCNGMGDYSAGVSLAHSFQQGNSYSVSLAVRNKPVPFTPSGPIDVEFILLHDTIPYNYQFNSICTQTPAIPSGSLVVHTINNLNDDFWQTVTFNINTLTDDYTQLWIRVKGSPGSSGESNSLLFDALCISEISSGGSTEMLTNNFYVAPCNITCTNVFGYVVNNQQCTGSVAFTATTSDPCNVYMWDFGDGTTYSFNLPSASHGYTEGIYTVTLTTTDVNGCTSVSTQQVAISNGFTVDIQAAYSLPNPDINMGMGSLVHTCNGNFYDRGGPSGSYHNSENGYMTFTPPAQGNLAQLDFSYFNSEPGHDYITIYNNSSASGTILYGPASGALSIGTITANFTGNPTGSLTVRFVSDATTGLSGWSAAISCITPGATSGPDTIVACQGVVQLNAEPSVPGNYFYEWSPAEGLSNAYIANPIASAVEHVDYTVTVTDINSGCQSTDQIDVTSYTWIVDTFELCSPTILLDFGPGADNYYWQGFTDTAGNHTNLNQQTQTLAVTQPGQYFGYAYYQGCGALTSLFTVVPCASDSVWPGDADANGLAHNMDLLSIGIGYGTQGLVRPNATINWHPEASPTWGQHLQSGTDYKHIDCNGSGIIDVDDTLAVIQNYGMLHSIDHQQHHTTLVDPVIYLAAPVDTVLTGTAVTIPVRLGTPSVPASDVYGIGFTIHYNEELIQTNSMGISFNNSWLGVNNLNLISIRHNVHGLGLMDVAVTRIDHMNVSGHGTIGELSFITIDNLSGKEVLFETLGLYITDVRLIRNDESEITLGIENDSIVITNSGNAVNELNSLEAGVSIYPNPAKESLNIVLTNDFNMQNTTCSVLSSTGQLISESVITNHQSSINVSDLAPGIYFLRISADAGTISKRFVVIR